MRRVADTAAELCHAAANNHIERLRSLACVPGLDQDKGDYDKRTALHLAASEGAFDAVVCLVEELGAKVSPVDRWGGTPLDDAVREGHTKVSEYLRSHGAQRGRSSVLGAANPAADVCSAAATNDLERLRFLSSLPGLLTDKGDYDKRTALHLAASEGAFDAVVCLVEELGAKVSPVDRWGGTPLDDAVREGHTKVSEYLQGKGAVFGVNGNTSSRNLAETEKHLEMIVRLAAQLQGGESAIHSSGDRWETSKTPVGEIEKCLASLCRPSSGRLGHRSSTKETAESS